MTPPKMKTPKPDLYAPDAVERAVWKLGDILEESREAQGLAITERAATAALLVAKQILGLDVARQEALPVTPPQAAPAGTPSPDQITALQQKVELAFIAARQAFGMHTEITELKQENAAFRTQLRSQLEMINDLRAQLAAMPPLESIDELIERALACGEPSSMTAVRQLASEVRAQGRRIDELEEPRKPKAKRSTRRQRVAV